MIRQLSEPMFDSAVSLTEYYYLILTLNLDRRSSIRQQRARLTSQPTYQLKPIAVND